MFFLSAYKSVYFFDDTNNIFLSVLSLHLTESLPTFLVEWSMLLKQVRQFARPLSCLLLIYLLRLHSALLYIHVLCTRDRKLNSSSTILSWFYATTIIPIAMARSTMQSSRHDLSDSEMAPDRTGESGYCSLD